MTREEAEEYGYNVQPYGGGFILVDSSGNRGTFGEAYLGSDGAWRSQPVGMTPFESVPNAWNALP